MNDLLLEFFWRCSGRGGYGEVELETVLQCGGRNTYALVNALRITAENVATDTVTEEQP